MFSLSIHLLHYCTSVYHCIIFYILLYYIPLLYSCLCLIRFLNAVGGRLKTENFIAKSCFTVIIVHMTMIKITWLDWKLLSSAVSNIPDSRFKMFCRNERPKIRLLKSGSFIFRGQQEAAKSFNRLIILFCRLSFSCRLPDCFQSQRAAVWARLFAVWKHEVTHFIACCKRELSFCVTTNYWPAHRHL